MRNVRVAAALIRREGLYLAGKRSYGRYAGFWEFPGGKLEPGEDSAAALVREIREELGIEIRIDSFFRNIQWDYPDFHLDLDCFYCSLAGSEPTLHDHTELRWFDPRDPGITGWLPADRQIIAELAAKASH